MDKEEESEQESLFIYSVLGGFLSPMLAGQFYRFPVPFFDAIGPLGEYSAPLGRAYFQTIIFSWIFWGTFFLGFLVHAFLHRRSLSFLKPMMSKSPFRAKFAAVLIGMAPLVYYCHIDLLFSW